MTRIENNERQNATERAQEAEISTMVIKEERLYNTVSIRMNDSSDTQSSPQRNPVQPKPQMEQ